MPRPILRKIVSALFRLALQVKALMTVLALVVLASGPRAEKIGDNLQIALPLMAWACAGARGAAGAAGAGAEFFLRYGVMFTAAHGSKLALGEAAINRRPDGGARGFPSAHTSTAVLGASALVHDCLAANPLAKAAVLAAAGFVGASRIEAGRHDIWQVMAGALLGYGCERGLRSPRARARAKGYGRRLAALIWAPLRRKLAAPAKGAAAKTTLRHGLATRPMRAQAVRLARNLGPGLAPGLTRSWARWRLARARIGPTRIVP